MSTLICFALKEEAAPFRKIAAVVVKIGATADGLGQQKSFVEKAAELFPRLTNDTCGF
jgi:hypothetical protein